MIIAFINFFLFNLIRYRKTDISLPWKRWSGLINYATDF